MAGFREFVTGEVLTASNVDDFLAKQAVMKFADAAARDAALGTAVVSPNALREGMVAWLDDTDSVIAYDGSAWNPVAAVPPAGIGSNVQQTFVNTAFSTSSATFVTVTGLEVTITPTSATSKILLLVSFVMSPSTSSGGVASWQISGGNATTYLGTGSNNGISHFNMTGSNAESLRRSAANQVGAFVDSPATASAVTYSVQIKSATGSVNVNQDSQSGTLKGVSSIIAIEVAA